MCFSTHEFRVFFSLTPHTCLPSSTKTCITFCQLVLFLQSKFLLSISSRSSQDPFVSQVLSVYRWVLRGIGHVFAGLWFKVMQFGRWSNKLPLSFLVLTRLTARLQSSSWRTQKLFSSYHKTVFVFFQIPLSTSPKKCSFSTNS